MSLFEFVLLLLALIILVKLISFTLKRAILLSRILKLKSLPRAEVEITNILAFFMPFIMKKAACRVKIRDKIYAVYLFDGKGHSYAAHIASETYAAVFMKSGGAVKARLFGRRVKTVHEAARVYFPKTVFLPEVAERGNESREICDIYEPPVIPVLLFSPASRELTYVSRERTSIKAAFIGDEVYGWKIFTQSSFERFIDRDCRGFYD